MRRGPWREVDPAEALECPYDFLVYSADSGAVRHGRLPTLTLMHILVLTDRDWTHPQGGGTGTNLFGQISRWLAWGHRVTVVASSYPGAEREERIGDLTIHRMGGRGTVFPRAIWKLRRGLVPDADVVLEVINGITFLTPLWLRLPRIALIHHVHREHYAQELGRLGKVAAFLLETAPLRWLYTRVALPDALARRGREDRRARHPARGHRRQLHRRRARRLRSRRARARADAALPRPAEEVQADRAAARHARDGPRRGARDRRRGRPPARPRGGGRAARPGRPRAHARARQRGAQARAPPARVGEPDGVVRGGLVPDRDGGGRVRHADRRARRRRPARVDRGRAHRRARERRARARREGARDRRGPGRARSPRPRRARARAHVHVGRGGATLARRARGRARGRARAGAVCAASSRAPTPAARPAWPAAVHGGERRVAHLHRRVRAHPRHVRLRHARRARVDLPDPAGAGLGAADHGRARGEHGDRAGTRGARRRRAPVARTDRRADPRGRPRSRSCCASSSPRRSASTPSGQPRPRSRRAACGCSRRSSAARSRASSATAPSGCRSSARRRRGSRSGCCWSRSGWA